MAAGDQVTTFELVSWPVLSLVLKHIPGTVNPVNGRYDNYALIEITSTADRDVGLGAAMVFPATLSIISNVFTGRSERAQAIGLWGATAGMAIALGPIFGGWLLGSFSRIMYLILLCYLLLQRD